MSKRKGTTTDLALLSLKKPKTEASRYTLLSTRSKSYILSEKEEADQQTTENDVVGETNLLLDHLTEENVELIEKHVKKILKSDKSKKTKHLRFTAACLNTIFRFLLKNEKEIPPLIVSKLQNCFRLVKIEQFEVNKYNEFLEQFAISTIRTNEINTRVGPLVSLIGSHLPTAYVDKTQSLVEFIHPMFQEILNTCALTENFLVELLIILRNMDLNHFPVGKKIAELVLNTIFQKEAPTDKQADNSLVTILNVSHQIIWSPQNIEKLIDLSFELLALFGLNEIRAFVYEKLIEMPIIAKKSLTEKVAYQKLETKLIEKFNEVLKNEFKMKKSNLVNSTANHFIIAFREIVLKHSLNAILNRFFACLYLSTNELMDKPLASQLNNCYLDGMSDLFEKSLHVKQSLWLENCTGHKKLVDELKNLFKYRMLICIIKSDELLMSGLRTMCMSILEHYVETDCSEFLTQPSNKSQYFSQFVSSILIQLMVSFPSSMSPIIMDLLNKCFVPDSNQNIFINQLDLLLVDQSFKNAVILPEFTKLSKSVVQRFYGLIKNRSSLNFFKTMNQFESVDQVVRLFDSLGLFFSSAKAEYLTDLINHLMVLTSHSTFADQNYEKYQKISVYGMISILKSINKISNKTYMNKQSNILKHSELIIANLRTIIKTQGSQSSRPSSISIIAELKSYTYQSFYKIIKSNTNLISSIIPLFIDQIKEVLISPSQDITYFDLDKCITSSDLKLTEPVDILLHCADLCLYQSIKLIDHNHSHKGFKPLIELKNLIESILKAYLIKSSQTIFDIYKKQTMNKVMVQESPAKSMIVVHQLLLGLIDAMIEHVVTQQQFVNISKMLEHYELTSSLISNEIEKLMSCKTMSVKKTPGIKRKLTNPNSQKSENALKTTLKKLKSTIQPQVNSSDKENPQTSSNVTRQTSTRVTRGPFANLTNKNVDEANKPGPSESAVNFSFANIQFDYTPRISYACCVKMLQISQCSNEKGSVNDAMLFNSPSNRMVLISLIINQKLSDYVVKIIDKKLKVLHSTSDYLHNPTRVYDPQSTRKEEIFDFLSEIWDNMCQRVNGTSNGSGDSIFNKNMIHNFSRGFLLKTHKFIGFCQTIWTLVNLKFQKFVPDLILNERRFYSMELEAESHNKLCWKFLLNCSKTVKLHLAPTGSHQIYASKCCSSMLSLMLEILKTVNLTTNEYDNFYQWLCQLAEKTIASEGEIYKSIINLMTYISNKRTSSAIIIKYLLLDYHQYMSKAMDTFEGDDSDGNEQMTQFQLISQPNSTEYQNFVIQGLVDLLTEFKWVVSKSGDFEYPRLFASLCKQLDPVTLSIRYAIKSIYDIKSVDLVIKLMIKFYDFMIYFFKSDMIEKLNSEEKEKLKDLIELINSRLQAISSTELNRIKELIINDEEQRDEKANSNDLIYIIEYQQLIAKLITTIHLFDKQLAEVNKTHKEINFLENYTSYIDSLELSFTSKVTRTISETQINNIFKSFDGNEVLI